MHTAWGESLLQLPEGIQGRWVYLPSNKSLCRWVQRRLPRACYLHCHRTCKLNGFSPQQGSLRHFSLVPAEISSGWITLCTSLNPFSKTTFTQLQLTFHISLVCFQLKGEKQFDIFTLGNRTAQKMRCSAYEVFLSHSQLSLMDILICCRNLLDQN